MISQITKLQRPSFVAPVRTLWFMLAMIPAVLLAVVLVFVVLLVTSPLLLHSVLTGHIYGKPRAGGMGPGSAGRRK
ncbi:MAG: hypothetical protein V2B18_18440 [Pseudomonadota bacterium]